MSENAGRKFLFIVNNGSGSKTIDWINIIKDFFSPDHAAIEFFPLPGDCSIRTLKDKIYATLPYAVVAVGGDGTVKLVAECLIGDHEIKLGILPAGSANGLAKELGISEDPLEALEMLRNNLSRKIHVVKINQELCIHLSDVGFNAYVVKKFQSQRRRGMLGYLLAALRVIFKNRQIEAELETDQGKMKIKAQMIVIANGTRYGSGAVINPQGLLDDELFEVIAVKKISFIEIYKMVVSHTPHNKAKTETFQTGKLTMRMKRRRYFQIDGEYVGKVQEIHATLIPSALSIIAPETGS